VSDGGLAVALAELVTDAAGADVTLPDRVAVFEETPGRLVVQTTDPEAVAELAGELPVLRLGEVTTDGGRSRSQSATTRPRSTPTRSGSSGASSTANSPESVSSTNNQPSRSSLLTLSPRGASDTLLGFPKIHSLSYGTPAGPALDTSMAHTQSVKPTQSAGDASESPAEANESHAGATESATDASPDRCCRCRGDEGIRPGDRRRRRVTRRQSGRVAHLPRAVRLREDDDAPDHCRVRGTDRGTDYARRRDRLRRRCVRPPEQRDVGIVFQNFALFPHLTVRENIAFGLGDGADATADRVDEMLDLVDLPEHGEKTPDQLSGGQKQRVALARSLAPEPDVLLLDEPFSNLDVRLRVEMREEVRQILKAAGVTAVSVTHDQEEALSISDRVAVMNEGQIEQVGRPESVFERPESKFVASFLGRASFLEGHLRDGKVETGIGRFDAVTLEGYDTVYDGTPVDVLVRPDDLRASPRAPSWPTGPSSPGSTSVPRSSTGSNSSPGTSSTASTTTSRSSTSTNRWAWSSPPITRWPGTRGRRVAVGCSR